MKILIAPDSFKGSLSSKEVAKHIQKGFERVLNNAQYIQIPVADGGEGTIDAIIEATNGAIEHFNVTGPQSNSVLGSIGFFDQNKAIIEVASASGLQLSPQKNIFTASSYGTGQLIKHALDKDIKTLYIGMGGSATNDAGIGILRALGIDFYNDKGSKLSNNLKDYSHLKHIDTSNLDPRLHNIEIILLSDVQNPLCGDKGASAIFGPQKGASSQDVKELDEILSHFATICQKHDYPDYRNTPGSGAAGGIGFGLLTFLNAKLVSGVDAILDITNIKMHLQDCLLVITGDGRMDYQTAYGKLPIGIARMAKTYNIPTAAIVGSLGEGYEAVYQEGIRIIEPCMMEDQTLEEAIKNAAENIENAAQRLMEQLINTL